MRKAKRQKITSQTFDDQNTLTYTDKIRTPDTMYILSLANASDDLSKVVFEVKQVAIESGNVLCHDMIRGVDILLSLKYNKNSKIITLCKDVRCYDFAKQQLIDFISSVVKY